MLIAFDGPLNLASTLESGQTFRWRRSAPPEPGGGWYAGVVFGNAVRMRQVPRGVEFRSSPDDESAMAPMLHNYLRLDDDLDAIYRSIGADRQVRRAIDCYAGMRIARQEPWECLVSFICSANSSIPHITANVEKVAGELGRPVGPDPNERKAFPTPEALAEAGERRLRQLGLGFRAKYVAATAAAIAERRLDLAALREASYGEALDALTTLPGVGDKVANCVMLFSLDKLEAFPVDVWVDRALREWYLDGVTDEDEKPAKKDMRAWAQRRFGPYAGYANQYLFHRRRLLGRS